MKTPSVMPVATVEAVAQHNDAPAAPWKIQGRRLSAVITLVVLLLGGRHAEAHKPNFQPLGWSGPWFDGVAAGGHPEQLYASFPSHVCIVAGAYTPWGDDVIPLTRQPIRVTNSQGLDTRYCTNSVNTKGWIVVIGTRGLVWAFQGLFDYSNTDGCDRRDYRCDVYTWACGWADRPWHPSIYYQATIQGTTLAGGTCPERQ